MLVLKKSAEMQNYFVRIGGSSLTRVLKYLMCVASFIFLAFIKAFFCALFFTICFVGLKHEFIYGQPNFS